MTTLKKTIGNFGEKLACDYLIRKGYQIFANNTKVGQKEIDIIAAIGGLTVFIEVKTSISESDSLSNEALSRGQITTIKKAIQRFCFLNHINLNRTRFDYISITLYRQSKSAKIRHYKDIY